MKIKLTYLFLLASLVSQAQLFKGLGFVPNSTVRELYSDTVDNFIYAGGNFTEVNGTPMRHISYFDGSTWKTMNNNWNGGFVETIVRFKGDIYFGGNAGIRRWNGTRVDSVERGVNGYVGDLLNLNDSILYVVGSFTKVNDTIPALGVATWDGNRWDTLPVNVPRVGSTNDFGSVQYYKGEWYFGGNFTGKYGDDIVRFDGKEWKDVGGGLQGDCWINDIEIYQNELYVTGEFKKHAGNADSHIMRWNGKQWKSVGGGYNYQADDLEVYHGFLFAGGTFDKAGGINVHKLAKWDGVEWCGYQTDFTNNVFSLTVYKDSLVVGDGYYTTPRHEQVQILTNINQTKECGVLNGVIELDFPDFKVYPNPVLNELKIEGSGTTQETDYKLINMQGQVLRSGNFLQLKFTINIEELVPGIYFLKLVTNNNNNRITKKIVKQ